MPRRPAEGLAARRKNAPARADHVYATAQEAALAARPPTAKNCVLHANGAVVSRDTPLGQATHWSSDVLAIRSADSSDWKDVRVTMYGFQISAGQANVLEVGSNSVMSRTAVRFAFVLAIGLASAAMAQEPEVPADALIRLQRTSCFGPCPIYTVTIDARGTVTYEGERSVRVVGRRTAQVDKSIVARLLATADSIQFFEMRDAYRVIENPDGTATSVTDLPTKFVSVTVNGRTKTVEDYVAAPDSLGEFEREIDTAAGTKRWVFLDENALDELARSGWLASGEEGATLLQQAIGRDDVLIAQRLIELGANLDGPPNNRLPPLISARSSSMVDLLVRFGANPNERPVDRVAARTPLMTTSYKEAPVAEALLKAGAHLET